MQLPNARVYDLLDSETYSRLLRRPKLLEEEIGAKSEVVVIDEIQKLPSLLDEVHRLIQKNKITFLLTGSSARKLKRGGKVHGSCSRQTSPGPSRTDRGKLDEPLPGCFA